MKKELKAFVSGYSWSYIINEKGHGFAMTLQGYGSCTPQQVLEGWLLGLPRKNWLNLWKECEKRKEKIV